MLNRFLISLILIGSVLQAETLNDICYEVPTETGFNMGPVGIMTKTTTPIHSLSNEILTDVEVAITSSTLFSMFSDCGVNDVSGNCENAVGKSFMVFSAFSEGVSYKVPDLNTNQNHTTYISSMFSFLSSNNYQWVGSYVKNGITYSGTIDPCLDTNPIQNDPIVLGSFNIENNSYNGETIANDDTNFNALFTQIVNKSFELKVVRLDSDFLTPKNFKGQVNVELIATPKTQTECENNLAVTSSNIIFNNSSFSPFNITVPTSSKNSSFRIKYLKDKNGQIVDWNSAYQCRNMDGSPNYNSASCMWSLLKNKVYDSTKCNFSNGFSGTECDCSDICNSLKNHSSNIDNECKICIFNSKKLTQSVCARDDFAIIPKKFEISSSPLNVTASDEFNLTIKALDENSALVTNYNEIITLNGNSPSITYNETKTQCDTGIITAVSNLKFNNGIANIALKYSEIGDLNLSIQEKSGSEFAFIDNDDSSNRFIQPSSVTISLLPYHFEINASYVNFNNANFTYLSRDLDMASVINISVTSKNKDNEITKNYNSQCYAKATDYNISFDMINTPNLSKIIYKKDDNISTPNEVNLTNSNFVLTNISKDIFTTTNKGVANLHVKVNFDRTKNKAVKPFKLTIQDLNINDENNITGSTAINEQATFVFGRTYSPRQRFEKIDAKSLLYFETYCGTSCDKTLLPDGTNSKYLDDPRWFINTKHTSSDFGEVGEVKQKGFNTDITANAESGYSIPKIHLNYNSKRGFPYKATLENNASSWLIYNKYNKDDTTNEFRVEFYKENTKWAGLHDTNTSVKKRGTSRTNRRIMW